VQYTCKSLRFSGGQIDNIIRKNEIYEIVHGITVDFNNIVEFCNAELLSKKNSFKVGFTKEYNLCQNENQ